MSYGKIALDAFHLVKQPRIYGKDKCDFIGRVIVGFTEADGL